MTMVTSPAWGMPAAPMLAAVAVMLQEGQGALLGPGPKEEAKIPGPLGTARGAGIVRNATSGSSLGGRHVSA